MSNDIVDAVTIAMLAIALIILFFSYSRIDRLLDRYRLKYGFDREIERKETSGDNTSQNEKMNRRERLFKRRVFKD